MRKHPGTVAAPDLAGIAGHILASESPQHLPGARAFILEGEHDHSTGHWQSSHLQAGEYRRTGQELQPGCPARGNTPLRQRPGRAGGGLLRRP